MVLGAGNIGGAIGELFARAGHEVFFSSRNPDNLTPLVARVGPSDFVGSGHRGSGRLPEVATLTPARSGAAMNLAATQTFGQGERGLWGSCP